MPARSADCRCKTSFTCGHCLRNMKPYHFTSNATPDGFFRFEPLPQRPDRFTDKCDIIEALCKTTYGCA